MNKSRILAALIVAGLLGGLLGWATARFWPGPETAHPTEPGTVATLLLGNAKEVLTESWPLYAEGPDSEPVMLEITLVSDRLFNGPRMVLRSPGNPDLGSLVLGTDTYRMHIEGRCLDQRSGKEMLIVSNTLSDHYPDVRVCGVSLLRSDAMTRFEADCHDGISMDGGFSRDGESLDSLLSCKDGKAPGKDDMPGDCTCNLDQLQPDKPGPT